MLPTTGHPGGPGGHCLAEPFLAFAQMKRRSRRTPEKEALNQIHDIKIGRSKMIVNENITNRALLHA
ncbi:hypothetical protein F0562_016839 [Nyssa sinensis]|uniref:Uncharacterized protein n=1 Tax=Nyssa sinensis TaxID=561372 RepID=A0A5J4ZDD1_9ASTE|nr:hypothetical protein F0562_016839 [Nyssa sinensis]